EHWGTSVRPGRVRRNHTARSVAIWGKRSAVIEHVQPATSTTERRGKSMRTSKVHAAVIAALGGGSVLAVDTAVAQEGALEEIVVTATRREENLQEVPISVVAVTGENLELRGIDTIEELSQAIPNIVATGGGGGTAGTTFSVRGIPNVGMYIDGIWQIDSAGALVREFVDLDRVEVLRGPQGTTFGRDSTGGAIRLWTKRPGEEFAGDVSVTAGSLDRRDVKMSVDVPLT